MTDTKDRRSTDVPNVETRAVFDGAVSLRSGLEETGLSLFEVKTVAQEKAEAFWGRLAEATPPAPFASVSHG